MFTVLTFYIGWASASYRSAHSLIRSRYAFAYIDVSH